jgi:hypothetical protein
MHTTVHFTTDLNLNEIKKYMEQVQQLPVNWSTIVAFSSILFPPACAYQVGMDLIIFLYVRFRSEVKRDGVMGERNARTPRTGSTVPEREKVVVDLIN